MEQVAVAPPRTSFGEFKETVDMVPGILRMPQDTSQPGSSHMRLGSREPQSPKRISSFPTGAASNSSQIKYATLVEPLRFYHCILPHKLITK